MILTVRVGVRVESVYPAGLGPAVSVLGLYEALVLRVRHELLEQERLFVVEFGDVAVAHGRRVLARDDDVGPVGAAHVESLLGLVETVRKAQIVLRRRKQSSRNDEKFFSPFCLFRVFVAASANQGELKKEKL